MTRSLISLAAAMLLAAPTAAADATIEGVRLGESISGGKLSADEL